MPTAHADGSEREERLHDAVAAYLEAAEAGPAPDQGQWLARYPEFAGELAEFFAARGRLTSLASPLPSPEGAGPGGPAGRGQLGDFRILREVGRGGMGVVYEAEQISLGRRVALKVLPFAATMDPRHLQRFQNEARAAASLHHPHIVPVHAVGCERGVHYYAMQFIDGQTLAELVRHLQAADRPADPGGSPGPPSVETVARVTPLPSCCRRPRAPDP